MADRETVVETGGGSAGMIFLGIAILLAVIIGGYFLLNSQRNDAIKTTAVTQAADSVGDAAKKVGDSATK